jgi:hypothetical protein
LAVHVKHLVSVSINDVSVYNRGFGGLFAAETAPASGFHGRREPVLKLH